MIEPTWKGARVLVLAPTPTHPQDHGNRLRIHTVCADLKKRGAEIHYVHYAAEADWRRGIPFDAAQSMAAMWDSYWTVPPSRPLHSNPDGAHHQLDEWWDPSIGTLLTWLFAQTAFDVMLVNYPWLSKAFEFAPRDVLKVLDTHDRFSGRKELFEAQGLAPEFFYLTEDAERAALDRADVVWAIKEQEAAFFATLTKRAVYVMPFSEPIRALDRSRPLHDILRFGIVGARNTINYINTRAFLETAKEYIDRSLLPCEFHIAGNCCEDLRHERLPPYVRLHGRVPDLTEFYRAVDVVLAPMTFSTGLKIKVGEALHLGKALIAHAHAYEGYPSRHPFHTLDSFEDMLRACRDVVRAPELIVELEDASTRAASATARVAAQTFEATANAREQLAPGVIISISAADVETGNLRFDHACEVAQYLGWIGTVHVRLHGPLGVVPDVDAFYRLGRLPSVMIAPELTAQGTEIAKLARRARLRRRSWSDLAEEGHAAVWFVGPTSKTDEMPRNMPFDGYMHLGAALCAAASATVAASLDRLATRMRGMTLIATADGPEVAELRHDRKARFLRIPLMFKGHQAQACWALRDARPTGVVILADETGDPLVSAVIDTLRISGVLNPTVVVPARSESNSALGQDVRVFDQIGYIREVTSTREGPALVFDVSRATALDGFREALDRNGTPRIALFQPPYVRQSRPGRPAFIAHGVFESLSLARDVVADLATYHSEARALSGVWAGHGDPGWALIWSEMNWKLTSAVKARAA